MPTADIASPTRGCPSEANRVARNRESARRSRASFAVRRERLEARRDALEEAAETWVSRVRTLMGDARTEAAIAEATGRAKAAFVPNCPPRRKPGSRTAVSDTELERLAAQGDARAQRMLSNRSSARNSRQKRWDEYNLISLRVDTLEAVVTALSSMSRSRSPSSSTGTTASPASPLRRAVASSASPLGYTSDSPSAASVVSFGTADAAALHDLSALSSAVEALRLPTAAPFTSTKPHAALPAAPAAASHITSPVDSAEVFGC